MSNVDQCQVRQEKLAVLAEAGPIYPNHLKPTHVFSEVLAENPSPEEIVEGRIYEVCGRIMTSRVMGKAAFFTLQDRSGQLQIYLRMNDVGEAAFGQVKDWDLGDIIYAKGHAFYTKMGELTLWISETTLLVKALRPLPDKFHGLVDQEVKYRQRYLDLIANEESRSVFKKRIKLIQIIRDFFVGQDYLEVETPMMQSIPGGAVARPFETHHNALNIPLYLRIAPELFLKRLVVGGFERVFEINRNFRNEGLSTRHNPEFTMLEFYQAYANYEDLMVLTEQLFKVIASELLATGQVEFNDQLIDLTQPIRRLRMDDAILQAHDQLSKEDLADIGALKSYIASLDIGTLETEHIEELQLYLFEETVESTLIQPTFITQYPSRTSPLARPSDADPKYADRFELFIAGQEIANGFSELNDPSIQAERFKEQVSKKQSGDHEAMYFDDDYIVALEHGLPPTAGQGIGIDRLAMILTGCTSIRDVIMFPTLRPKEHVEPSDSE